MGEFERASAARVGRIDAESSAGHLQAVLDDTAGEIVAASGYFRVRLRNQRCLAFEGLGRYDEAVPCYRETLAELLALDERGEYASTLRNLAGLRRKQGFLDEAVALAKQGLDAAIGPYAPMTRGRLHLLLAVIAQQRGDIGVSMRETEEANADLAQAGTGALFWRTSALLNQAIVFEQLGAYEEAYASLAAVTALAGPEEQLALRTKIFADLEADTRHADSSRMWSRIAQTLFERGGLLPAADAVRLTRLQRQLAAGDSTEIAEALRDRAAMAPLYEPQWRLLAAHFALAQHRAADAGQWLADIAPSTLPLRVQFRYVALRARSAAQTGDAAGAIRQLAQTSLQWDRTLQRVRSPLLRQVLERQRGTLQSEAIEIALSQASAPAQTTAETVWPWIAWTSPPMSASAHTPPASADRFDAAIAAELLPLGKATGDASARAALWSLMAGASQEPVAMAQAAIPNLDAFRRTLDDDTTAIAYLEADTRGAVLWISKASIVLREAAVPTDLRRDIAALQSAARSADTPVAAIDAAAARVAADLFQGAPAPSAPGRLVVLPSAALDGALFDLLPWPDSGRRLIDTTRVSRLRFAASDRRDTRSDATTLFVETAPQNSTNEKNLPRLWQAQNEAALIRAAVAAQPLSVVEEMPRSKAAMLAALSAPGAWVHIAAHGAAQPGRIGVGGIWLEPAAGASRPDLLTTVDVLDSDVRADLVVLASCRLGDYGDSIDANLRFADAIGRAGARQVIAALWPVSDSAAAVWVPAFYSALAADPEHDAAAALHAAKERLRQSRAFAHPFFWAGLEAAVTWRAPTP